MTDASPPQQPRPCEWCGDPVQHWEPGSLCITCRNINPKAIAAIEARAVEPPLPVDPEPRHAEGQGEVCDPDCPHWSWSTRRLAASVPLPVDPERHAIDAYLDAEAAKPGATMTITKAAYLFLRERAALTSSPAPALDVERLGAALHAEKIGCSSEICEPTPALYVNVSRTMHETDARDILARLSGTEPGE